MEFFQTSKIYSLRKSTYINLRWTAYFGQLTDRAQKQNAKHFKSFCKLGESKTESIRPLLRSLIVRELDRIKNGN